MTEPSPAPGSADPGDDRTPDELRPEILDAVLAHVPFDGWSETAVRHAAADLGIKRGLIALAFPGGPAEMIEAFSDRADRELETRLTEVDLASMKVRERVALAIRTRIEGNSRHREAARHAVTFLALPHNMARGACIVWRTADTIWRALGDRSTDASYYTKRAILSDVFSVTVLYWLNDESPDHADTWSFVDRRINDIMAFEKVKAKLGGLGDVATGFIRTLGRLRYGV